MAIAGALLVFGLACSDGSRSDGSRSDGGDPSERAGTDTPSSSTPPTTAVGAATTVTAVPPVDGSISSSTTVVGSTPKGEGPVIVVDPGHNGANNRHAGEINRMVDAGGFQKACNTTGAAGDGLSEPEFTWLLAAPLRNDLSAWGATVVLTRQDNDGWGPCVDVRGQTAARNGARALVSLHADGAAPASNGFHIISPSAGSAVSAQTAAASAQLATAVRDELVAAGFPPSNYAGRNGLIARPDLGTLNRAEVPAIIIEFGNMKNSSDLAWMASPDSRNLMAAAVSRGVEKWSSSTG